MKFGKKTIVTCDEIQVHLTEGKNVNSRMENENDKWRSAPLKSLKTSTRMNLCKMMDVNRPIPLANGLLKDWVGLAELAGYTNDYIIQWRNRPRPTETLLEFWENRANVTVDSLLINLETLGRFDVIDDLQEQIQRDAINHYSNVRSNSIDSIFNSVPKFLSPSYSPEIAPLTIDDIPLAAAGLNQVQHYDAYVCYTPDDKEFVYTLCSRLEKEHNFKLFVQDRDLLGGTNEYEAAMQLISNRCNKVLVILSPEFLQNPQLQFLTSLAHRLSLENKQRKVIPIIYKDCEVPLIIRSLSKLAYNDTFKIFWPRLIDSLKANSNYLIPPSSSCGSSCGSSIEDLKLTDDESDPSSSSGFISVSQTNLETNASGEITTTEVEIEQQNENVRPRNSAAASKHVDIEDSVVSKYKKKKRDFYKILFRKKK